MIEDTIRLRNDAATDYLARIQPRFIEHGYIWEENVDLQMVTLRCIAELPKKRFVALNDSQILFLFAQFETVSVATLREFAHHCKRAADTMRPPRRVGGSCVIPVAMVYKLDGPTSAAILEGMPQVIGLGRVLAPVVYNLETQRLLFSKRRRILHLVTWPALYQLIEEMLTP